MDLKIFLENFEFVCSDELGFISFFSRNRPRKLAAIHLLASGGTIPSKEKGYYVFKDYFRVYPKTAVIGLYSR